MGLFPDENNVLSLRFNASTVWEILPQSNNVYIIRYKQGCPASSNCNAALAWDFEQSEYFVQAGVQHGSLALWEIAPRGEGFVIRSHFGCPENLVCTAELSVDYYGRGRVKARVTEQLPVVDWMITRIDGIQTI